MDKKIALVGALTISVTIIASILYKKWNKQRIPQKWEKIGMVNKIHLYPLKSGHRKELEKAEVTNLGIQDVKEPNKIQLLDRALIVYTSEDKEFRTARIYPKLVFIDVTVQKDDLLALTAPGMNTLYVKLPKEQQPIFIKFWKGEPVKTLDFGDEAAIWISRYIKDQDEGLRLGYYDVKQKRDISKTREKLMAYYKNLTNESTGLFNDLTSVSLINQNSINDLNARLEVPLPVEQFRHNIIVDGVDLKPYDEENWQWIKIGNEVVLRRIKDCTRCIMTTINNENGIRNLKREPLLTLGTYRKSLGPDSGPRLGLNLDVAKTGVISVGEAVYIVRSQ